MATYNVAVAKHATLGAAAEDIVNLSAAVRGVTVVNRGAVTDFITVRIGPTTGSGSSLGPPAVTALADDAFVLTGGNGSNSRYDFIVPNVDGKVTVRLISAGTPAYSVQSLPVVDA